MPRALSLVLAMAGFYGTRVAGSSGAVDTHPYYLCFHKPCPSYRKSIRKVKIEEDFATLISSVAPSAGTFAVAKRMFTDIWDARLARSKERAAEWKRGIADIEKKTDALVLRLIESENRTVKSEKCWIFERRS